MPNLEHILESLLIVIISFSIGFFLKEFLLRKEMTEYKESYKHMIENFLGLNVTHLHDSANLFNLIKNNSNEQNIINFATGSAYHFRSIFNSLKKSILQIREYDPSELNNSSLYKLIEKEEVDLKDLINIELFQLGNFSQIQVTDSTTGQYAFTHGNFELLSKVFLNLVENALKYSQEKIKISLTDENNLYTVRIMSFGKSISENISLRINNKIYDDIEGHGLSSLVDIMNYHDANIHITSLPNEGSSINLEFKKAANAIKTNFASQEVQTTKIQIKKTPLILAASFLLVLSSYSYVKSLKEPISSRTLTKKLSTLSNTSPNLVKESILETESKEIKLASKQTKPVNTELSHLNDLIDQETAKLGLNMDL